MVMTSAYGMLCSLVRGRSFSRVGIQQQLDELLGLFRRLCTRRPKTENPVSASQSNEERVELRSRKEALFQYRSWNSIRPRIVSSISSLASSLLKGEYPQSRTNVMILRNRNEREVGQSTGENEEARKREGYAPERPEIDRLAVTRIRQDFRRSVSDRSSGLSRAKVTGEKSASEEALAEMENWGCTAWRTSSGLLRCFALFARRGQESASQASAVG